MIIVSLVRIETGNQGTFGKLHLTGFDCVTLELPWRDLNKDGLSDKGRSCLPAGNYVFRWSKSPKHGECYQADISQNAPNRDHIQIHAANLAGDVADGYVSQLEGCIAPGLSILVFRKGFSPAGDRDQKGVAASKTALRALETALKLDPFELQISWAKGLDPEGREII